MERPVVGPLAFENDITRFIERSSRWFFVGLALLYLCSFNGQWRLGMDSSNYRGLADSLATGRGYTFGDWAPYNVYPGLPIVLAACQKVTVALGGSRLSAVLPCLVMLAFSVITLRLTYLLIARRFPKWVAVSVTFMLGTNACYLQQTSELMTDVPFAMGVVLAMYGWETLRDALHEDGNPRRARRIALSIGRLLTGLAIAAAMRPTFLIFIAAGFLACLVGLLIGPQRKFYAIVLIMMLAVWAAFIALDPRSRGFHPLSGGYEREATEILTNAPTSRVGQLFYVLNDQFPAGFFGEQLSLGSIRIDNKKYSPSSILGSLIVIAAPLLLLRRYPLWTFLAWMTVVVTILYAAEPRYYLMIMPVLLLAWVLMCIALARRLPGHWSNVALAGGLLLVTLNNVSASVAFIREQRSFDFLEHYKKGKYIAPVHMAAILRDKLKPDETAIGPGGSLLSYLSGRHIYTQRELLKPHLKVSEFPATIAAKKIRYAIFPAPLYRDKEPAMSRLMLRGVLRPVHRVAVERGMRLETLHVTVPPGDWQKLPRLNGAKANFPRPPKKKTVRKPGSATTSTTSPANPSATTRSKRPIKKKKKKPATTMATTRPTS